MGSSNLVIVCSHTECPYWCESMKFEGECGKRPLYWNDKECVVLNSECEDVNEFVDNIADASFQGV